MTLMNKIPIYGLQNFRKTDEHSMLYQVEIFDANRHFQVSYPHRHDFYEILYITNGSGWHIIDNERYMVTPPCIFFLSPGQAHKLEFSHDIDGFIFLFTSEFYLSQQKNNNRLLEFPFFFSAEQKNPPLLLNNSADSLFLKELFSRSCYETTHSKHQTSELIRSFLDLILLTCNNLYPDKLRSIHTKKGHILVKRFLCLIEENYQKNLRINDYASLLAITPNHLTQMVKQVTGKTSIELLQEKLIVEVKRLLIHSNASISEISQIMNYPDQSYFTKFFKKYTGITPLQYRKESMKST